MSRGELHFIPGCYRNLPCNPGESLPGYLLRLAEANGYAGIRDLLKMADIRAIGSISKVISQLKTSSSDLGMLSSMAVGVLDHLKTHLAQEIADEAVLLNGCRVDNDAFLVERAQVCPHCLRENGFAFEEWDLAVVTACSRHEVRLNDSCHGCNQPIAWTRRFLNHCGRCGVDFREAPAAPVENSVHDVAGDFAALAPFRLTVYADDQQVHPWDTAFRLFKCLSLTGAHWSGTEWPARHLQTLTIERRHAVTELLAASRHDGSYVLTKFNEFVKNLLAPLGAVPRPGLIQSQAMKLLHSEAGLPREIASAVCSLTPILQEPYAAHTFGGHPPSISSLTVLATFLAVDRETVAGLLANRLLETPLCEHPGFDIDQVLAAQKFLSEGLLTLSEIAAIVGVPLDCHDPFFSELFPVWNRRNLGDLRVTVAHVLDLQSKLCVRWRDSPRPAKPVLLSELAGAGQNPFRTVAKAVTAILSSGIQRLDWGPPFQWASLVIDEHDATGVLKDARRNR